MMKMQWTKPQQDVIDNRDGNLLVSAAAGSGKTAVLVEHIIQKVLDEKNPADIDSLMVVTFTGAAAGEMRERILAAIEKAIEANPGNRHLQKQMTYIHNAKITTLHSFCLSIVREHFNIPDIDPGFRIGDNGEVDMLKSDVVKEVIEEFYQSGREDFHQLVEQLAQKNSDDRLEEYVLDFYKNACSSMNPKEWMMEMANYYNDDADRGNHLKYVSDYAEAVLEDALMLYEMAIKVIGSRGGPVSLKEKVETEYESVKYAYNAEDFADKCKRIMIIKFPTMRASKDGSDEEKRESVKKLRNEAKDEIKKLQEEVNNAGIEKLDFTIGHLRNIVKVFAEISIAFAQRYEMKKREKNMLDFDDIEHMALEILTIRDENGIRPSAVADELAISLNEVIVDEYQDINQVQDTILNCLSRERFGMPNMFMVGDVKQSIYGFRKADPELFMNKYDEYSKDGEQNKKILLGKNFRSRKEVIDSINYIFRKIMYKEMGGIEYEGINELNPGADYPEVPENQTAGTEIMILENLNELEKEKDENGQFSGIERRQAEARMTAGRIKELTDAENGYKIYDKNTGGYRTARYSDILVLLRSTRTNAGIYMDEFMAAGIPVYFEQQTGYFDTVEVNGILSYLNIIDNPHQDIYLAATLTSMFGGLTDGELASIRGCSTEKEDLYDDVVNYMSCGESENLVEKLEIFMDKLTKYRKMSTYTSIHDLISFIINDTSYDSYVRAMPAGGRRMANVDMLKEKALEYENGSYRGLFNFVRYIEKIKKYDIESGEASVVSENEDVVRIMSIHKSKGLEYPIVFLCNTNGKLNDMDIKKPMIIHKKLGIGLDYIDTENRVKYKSIFKESIKKAFKNESKQEEIRVLYVALTRAKEKLIITASKVNTQKYSTSNYTGHVSRIKILNSTSYMDMIGYSLGKDILTGNKYFGIKYVNPLTLVDNEIKSRIAGDMNKQNFLHWDSGHVYSPKIREEIKSILDYRYPYREATRRYAKVSVSDIKRQAIMDDEDYVYNLVKYSYDDDIIPKFISGEDDKKISGMSGASRGTAYHKAFELLDFGMENSDYAIKTYLDRLCETGKLDRMSRKMIRTSDIAKFYSSNLGARMKRAWKNRNLHRETQFVVGINGKQLYNNCDEEVLVQGIIDAYFVEDGEIVLVDYKTDRVESTDELVKRYKVQLELYKYALQKITGIKVKEVIIYSVCLSEVIKPEMEDKFDKTALDKKR